MPTREADGLDATGGSSGPEARTRPATIYDVARVAGVSHQLVSRLLKGEIGIKPANRERVMRALEELDYRPNAAARSLATRRSRRVAVLTDEIAQVGPGRIVQGAGEAARANGYFLDVVALDVRDREAIENVIRDLASQDLAAIVALASTDELTDVFEQVDFRVPVILGAEHDDAEGGNPSHLNGVAIPMLVRHLVELGHRQLLHVAGPAGWAAARNRERALRAAVRGHPSCTLSFVAGDWSAASGFAAVADRDLAGITAVIAANDQMAIGSMLALSERGLRVPEDVAVTGIDDIPEAAYLNPPLTTVRVDFDRQGRDTFARALAVMHGATTPPVDQIGELIVRRSTGPAPRSYR